MAGAIRLDEQAELQPRSYLLGLAEALEAAGGTIHEHTTATGLTERGGPVLHTAAGHDVRADHVVVATLFPFLDRGLFFARLRAMRSYAIAVRAAGAVPAGMFISADSPTRSIRAHPASPDADGELLIIGGEGHPTGEQGDTTAARYRRLAAFAAERFGATDVTHRWSSHDLKSVDGLPYVGKLLPTARASGRAPATASGGSPTGRSPASCWPTSCRAPRTASPACSTPGASPRCARRPGWPRAACRPRATSSGTA